MEMAGFSGSKCSIPMLERNPNKLPCRVIGPTVIAANELFGIACIVSYNRLCLDGRTDCVLHAPVRHYV